MKAHFLLFDVDGKLIKASDKSFLSIKGAQRARTQLLKELGEKDGIGIYKAVEFEKIEV